MAKIVRQTAQIFGSSASPNQIAQFGSLAAGSPTRYSGATATPNNVQALGNWTTGWFGAVEGGNSPAIEDLNAVNYVNSYQAAYLLEMGIPEYDADTTYYLNSFCQSGGTVYRSLQNSNLGNTPSSNPSVWFAAVSSGISATTGLVGNTTFTGSLANVSGLSVSYTSTGKDLYIALQNWAFVGVGGVVFGNANGSGQLTLTTNFTVDGSSFGTSEQAFSGLNASQSLQWPASAYSVIAIGVAAGTHTINFQGKTNVGTSAGVTNVKLLVKEF